MNQKNEWEQIKVNLSRSKNPVVVVPSRYFRARVPDTKICCTQYDSKRDLEGARNILIQSLV